MAGLPDELSMYSGQVHYRTRPPLRSLRHSALLFLLGWTSCSYVGTFVPVLEPGVRVLSRCSENDSAEVNKGGVTVTASGSWSNATSKFFVTVANPSPDSVQVILNSIVADWGNSQVSANWLVADGKFYDLPLAGSGEQTQPQGSRQNSSKKIPTLLAAGSERLFQVSMESVLWKGFDEEQRVVLIVPVLMDGRVVAFDLPFTVGRRSNPHLKGACPLGVHPAKNSNH